MPKISTPILQHIAKNSPKEPKKIKNSKGKKDGNICERQRDKRILGRMKRNWSKRKVKDTLDIQYLSLGKHCF